MQSKKEYFGEDLKSKYGDSVLQSKTSEFLTEVKEANKSYKNSAIAKMDSRYVVASIGGKIRIFDKLSPYEQQWDIYNARENFHNYTFKSLALEKIVEGDDGELLPITVTQQVSSFEGWFDIAERYRGTVLRPNMPYGRMEKNEVPYFNLWKGWAVQPNDSGTCQKLKDCILNDICNKNQDAYEYLMDYLAEMIQHPDRKNPKIIVIQGLQGTFKTTVMDVMTHIMGEDYAVTMTDDMLTNHFNSLLFGKIMAIADESIWAGKRELWGRLKALTGNIRLPIEGKGKDTVIADNYLHLFVTTNESYSFPNERSNRRSVYFKTSDEHLNNSVYRQAIDDELQAGGYERFMYELLNRQVKSNFHGPCPIFSPEQFAETRLESLSSENPIILWALASLQNNTKEKENLFFIPDEMKEHAIHPEYIPATYLYDKFDNWRISAGEPKQVSQKFFGMRLAQIVSKKHFSDGEFYAVCDRDAIAKKTKAILGYDYEKVDI